MVVVHGVDGARGGWAVAVLHVGGPCTADDALPGGQAPADDALPGERLPPGPVVARLGWRTVGGQDAVGLRRVLDAARADGAVAVGIDCPIGLPSSAWRPCDLAAKRRLGRGSARVFLAPPRAVLAAPTYADARTVSRDALGKGVSAQAYGIRRIVLAVDDALRPSVPSGAPGQVADRARGSGHGAHWAREHLLEVHPELSFMAMTGRAPGDPLPSKRTPAGRAARLAAVAGWLGDGPWPPAPDGDDHLDALAVAWSAWRWWRGIAEQLGGEPDEAGLPMRIVV